MPARVYASCPSLSPSVTGNADVFEKETSAQTEQAKKQNTIF